MGRPAVLSWWHRGGRATRSSSEPAAGLPAADLDAHLKGVVRRPSSGPPWPPASWERYACARRREPSAMARVMLDLHPAFAGVDGSSPRWLDVDRAEAFALEWAMFSPAEAAQWLATHPAVSSQQAYALSQAGWRPHDAALALPERVIALDRQLGREVRRTG